MKRSDENTFVRKCNELPWVSRVLFPFLVSEGVTALKVLTLARSYSLLFGEQTFPPGQFTPGQFPLPTRTIPPPVPLNIQLVNLVLYLTSTFLSIRPHLPSFLYLYSAMSFAFWQRCIQLNVAFSQGWKRFMHEIGRLCCFGGLHIKTCFLVDLLAADFWGGLMSQLFAIVCPVRIRAYYMFKLTFDQWAICFIFRLQSKMQYNSSSVHLPSLCSSVVAGLGAPLSRFLKGSYKIPQREWMNE